MRRRSVFLRLPVFFLLLILLSACGTSSSPPSGPDSGSNVPGVTDTEIVLGTFGPLTGPAAAYGDSLKALEGFIKYANDQGGVHGRTIRLIVEDDQYQPSKTVAAVRKMVEQDKVFALVYPVGTSSLSAVKDYLIENQVPVLFYATGSPKFQGIPTFFAGLLPYDIEAKILVRYGAETLGARRFAVFYQNDDMGKEALHAVREAVPRLGGEVVAEATYNPVDVDLSASILKLKEASPDAVVVYTTVKHGALVLKEAQKIGFKPHWLFSSVSARAQTVELTEGAAEGIYTVGGVAQLTDTDNPVVAHYLEHHARYVDNGPMESHLNGWNAGYATLEALSRAGRHLTREGLIAALETFRDFEALYPMTFTAESHVGLTKGWIRQLQNGVYVKVSDYIDANY